jgi:hypothetical protein
VVLKLKHIDNLVQEHSLSIFPNALSLRHVPDGLLFVFTTFDDIDAVIKEANELIADAKANPNRHSRYLSAPFVHCSVVICPHKLTLGHAQELPHSEGTGRRRGPAGHSWYR